MTFNKTKCQICARALGEEQYCSKHHLVPKSRGGKHTDTILIHNICHRKIHSLFTEKELRDHYNTAEKLIQHEEMIKFIKWVRKKDPSFYEKSKNHRRK